MRRNDIVRIIARNKKFSLVTHLYEKLNILKLKDIYEVELAKFMHKIYNNKLQFLQNRLCRSDRVHLFKTRRNINSNYYLPRVSKTIAQKTFVRYFEASNFGIKLMIKYKV